MLNRFSTVRRHAARIAGYALMSATFAACSGSDGGTITTTSAITVALGASSGSLTAGGTSSVAVTVSRSGSFTGAVDLSVEGLPTGVTASITPSPVQSGVTSATVTLTAAATAAATTNTPLTIRAKGSGVTDATAAYALSVQAAPANGFTLSLAPATLSLTAGTTGTSTITIARTGAFAGAVGLTVSGAPAGVTATLSSASVAGTSATLTVDVAAAAAAGASTLTITGTGTGAANQSVTLGLTTVAAATGSFALSLSPATLSIAAGANATSTVTIARTAPFAGAVNLAVSAPAGVTATLSSASVTGTTATLTVAVAAGTAASTGNVVVTGTAAGVANATATLALTTTASGTGTPGTGAIVFRFCSTTPSWFAVQDGQSGTWTRVTGSNNTYSFDLTNNLGGVAYATVSGTAVNTNVYYGTKAELTMRGVNDCPSATTKNITGSVAGISGLDQGAIAFGNRSTIVVPAAGLTWALNAVPDGAHDLVASKIAYALSGTSISGSLAKVAIRRALNPASGAALPVIDFGTEGAAPASATATITNLASDQPLISVIYLTANGTTGLLYSDFGGSGTSRPIMGVPASLAIAGDLHIVTATALAPGALTNPDPIVSSTLRSATNIIGAIANTSFALGPALSAPTVTTVATTPYVRLKSVLPRQAEYNQQFYTNFSQSGTNARNVTIEATVAWVGAGSFDATVPDFSGVAGWDNNWGMKAGVSTVWTTNSTGFSGSSTQTAAAGYTALNAQKAGTITP
jgi:hypothetical protein